MYQHLVNNAKVLRRNLTKAEIILWKHLQSRQMGFRFNRQFIFENKYILDFYCAGKKLVIEIDGGQHNDNKNDELRDKYLKSRGCKVLRFWNNEIEENINGCLFLIKEVLRK